MAKQEEPAKDEGGEIMIRIRKKSYELKSKLLGKTRKKKRKKKFWNFYNFTIC